jgi:hypothetical protein
VDGKTMEASCESVTKIHQKVALLVPEFGAPTGDSHGGSHDGSTDTTLERCDPADHPHEKSDLTCACPDPNINCRKFDDRRPWGYRSDRIATVGTTEKWEIRAFDGHPFHIHINPFVVCPNDSNKEPNFAHWRDTFWVQLEDGPRQILHEFSKFTGQYVLHCHKLNHEDEGMMELVEICEEGDEDCLCLGKDDAGACIPTSGCYEDDVQCKFAAVATEAFPAPPAPTPDLCGGPTLP